MDDKRLNADVKLRRQIIHLAKLILFVGMGMYRKRIFINR